jgi:hypothetical protein
MAHWRTARAASGAQPPRGPLTGADTTRTNSNILPFSLADRTPSRCDRLNSRSQEVEPFIHPFELGSHLLFLALLLLPLAIVGGIVIGYLTFVPQAVEYQSGVEAYRFKGH